MVILLVNERMNLNMSEKTLTLKLLKETFAVCRLNKNEVIPDWINTSDFYSITKTEDELSIVCSQESVPKDIKHEDDFKALKIEGPLDFSLIGILSKISTILAKSKISIFAISTSVSYTHLTLPTTSRV